MKIADTTLKKRLDEFRKTPSGRLTLADFRRVWLEEEQDPPAFTKGNEKEERERRNKIKGKKRKREKDKEEEEEEEEEAVREETTQDVEPEMEESIGQVSKDFDPLFFEAGMGADGGLPLFFPEIEMDEDSNIDPALRERPPSSPLEMVVGAAVAEEVSAALQTDEGLRFAQALNDRESRQNVAIVPDEFADLDDEELDQFILTEEEVKIKERVWVEMNKDYLEALAGELRVCESRLFVGDLTAFPRILVKAEMAENLEGKETKSRKVRSPKRFTHTKKHLTHSFQTFTQRRKTSTKPRDTSTPHGTTAAESVRNLLKKNPRYSKKINYAVLDQFFKPEKSSTPGDGEEEGEGEEGGKEGVGMHRVDENENESEKDEIEVEEVVEEGGEYLTPLRANPDYEDDEDDKPEEYGGWEDAFEQEV